MGSLRVFVVKYVRSAVRAMCENGWRVDLVVWTDDAPTATVARDEPRTPNET